jgi:hypothetical protein
MVAQQEKRPRIDRSRIADFDGADTDENYRVGRWWSHV